MATSTGLSLNQKIKIFKVCSLIRHVEAEISKRYSYGKMRCPVHLSIGQEGVPAALSLLINKNDFAVSTHRAHAHYISKGGSIKKMIAEIYGKSTGCSGGKGGSMHLTDKNKGFMGSSSIVGNSIPLGVGLGLSLKLISGQTARYEEVNVSEKFYDSLKGYDYTLGDITCKLGVKKDGTGQPTFETQDSIITLKGTQGPVAKFQIKGNTTSRLANLKFEPTEIGATSARLGKAPLELVQKLSDFYSKKLYNNKYQNFPQDLKQFNNRENEFATMFMNIKNKVTAINVDTKEEFIKNMRKVFKGKTSHIANVKLMQIYFIDQLLKLKKKEQNEYLTDLLFLAQKKGNKVFDFGPFGKLY